MAAISVKPQFGAGCTYLWKDKHASAKLVFTSIYQLAQRLQNSGRSFRPTLDTKILQLPCLGSNVFLFFFICFTYLTNAQSVITYIFSSPDVLFFSSTSSFLLFIVLPAERYCPQLNFWATCLERIDEVRRRPCPMRALLKQLIQRCWTSTHHSNTFWWTHDW